MTGWWRFSTAGASLGCKLVSQVLAYLEAGRCSTTCTFHDDDDDDDDDDERLTPPPPPIGRSLAQSVGEKAGSEGPNYGCV